MVKRHRIPLLFERIFGGFLDLLVFVISSLETKIPLCPACILGQNLLLAALKEAKLKRLAPELV